MQHFQDTETGQIHGFDDGVDPMKLGYRSIPKTLSSVVKQKPNEDHVWLDGDWVHKADAPAGYAAPVSSVLSYDPAWHAFLQPYTWVLQDEEVFSITLEQINTNAYAGERLGEPVFSLVEFGIPALLSRDGAIALPMRDGFLQQHAAVDALNRIFCALLIGGIHAEFVSHNEALPGCLGEDKRLIVYTPTQHGRYRHMDAAISERMNLLHPRVIRVAQLRSALGFGLAALSNVKNLSPAFLLHGYTAVQHQSASEALSSLWIVVEQVTSFLWEERVLKDSNLNLPDMKKQLRDVGKSADTAKTAVKHELLSRATVISTDCYSRLSSARDERNYLVHEGRVPDMGAVTGLWPALCEILETASGVSMEQLESLGQWNHQPSVLVGKANFGCWDATVKNLA